MSHTKATESLVSLEQKTQDGTFKAGSKKSIPPLISLASGMVAGSTEAVITVCGILIGGPSQSEHNKAGSIACIGHDVWRLIERQYPFEFAKTRLQLKSSGHGVKTGPLAIVRQTAGEVGLAGLYVGCSTLVAV
jgi:hypothetical protein